MLEVCIAIFVITKQLELLVSSEVLCCTDEAETAGYSCTNKLLH